MAEIYTPEFLCRKGTEDGHQKAVFAWANTAMHCGFAHAWDMNTYAKWPAEAFRKPVPELRWLHATPNGGARTAAAAAMMKAEGVKRGIPDMSLPIPMGDEEFGTMRHGLYVELKKLKDGRISEEQLLFQAHCKKYGYAFVLALGWREACTAIQNYLEGKE